MTAASGSAKRALTSLRLRQRYEVIQELSRGDKQVDMAKKYEVDGSTITRIRKNSSAISAQYESGTTSHNVKRQNTTRLDDVDAALLECFRNTSHGQPGVSGAVLQEKAKQLGIALRFGEDLEKLDINWVNRFKARHSIVAKILYGEAAVVAPEAVEKWRNNTVAAIHVSTDLKIFITQTRWAFFGDYCLIAHLILENKTALEERKPRTR